VPEHVFRQCLQVDDEELALRFLNVALAVEAVGSLVKTCASNVLLSADDVHPLVALALVLDVGALLSLDALAAPEVSRFLRSGDNGPFESHDLVVSKSEKHLHWRNARQKYQTDLEAAQVSFTLHAADRSGPEGAPSASGQLSRGCGGSYKTLSVLLTRGDASKKIVDLELRPGRAGGSRPKRKRPELAWD
jgi:hypothetical protein